jgi:uncharacterized protein YqgQ
MENRDFYEENNESSKNIFRYKFEVGFVEKLNEFSKIHQYDHRKDFKEAWNIWIEDNEEIVNKEIKRLIELDYKSDVLDKMFKSARYYFRKKSTEKKDPKKRRSYVGIQAELLAVMDLHISNNKNKPSTGFENFCKENVDMLKIEVTNLYKSGIVDAAEIRDKIKKTYKNRYFMILHNSQIERKNI